MAIFYGYVQLLEGKPWRGKGHISNLFRLVFTIGFSLVCSPFFAELSSSETWSSVDSRIAFRRRDRNVFLCGKGKRKGAPRRRVGKILQQAPSNRPLHGKGDHLNVAYIPVQGLLVL